jgi:hypothetical protein
MPENTTFEADFEKSTLNTRHNLPVPYCFFADHKH